MDDLQNQINALKNQSSGSHGPVLDVSFIGDDGSKTVKFFIITYTDGTTKQIPSLSEKEQSNRVTKRLLCSFYC